MDRGSAPLRGAVAELLKGIVHELRRVLERKLLAFRAKLVLDYVQSEVKGVKKLALYALTHLFAMLPTPLIPPSFEHIAVDDDAVVGGGDVEMGRGFLLWTAGIGEAPVDNGVVPPAKGLRALQFGEVCVCHGAPVPSPTVAWFGG